MISGFHRDADEVCALLRYYTAYNGSSLPTFRNFLSVPYSRALEDGANWLSRNVGKELPLYAA